MDNNIYYNKQALELIELMKKGTLSIEQLKQLVPMTTGFLTNLCEALKEEISNSHQSQIETIKVLGDAIDALKDLGKIENCPDDIKKDILDKIYEISKWVKDLQQVHEENSKQLKWGMLAIAGTIVAIVLKASLNDNQNK